MNFSPLIWQYPHVSSATAASRFRPDIQGLRAIAVLAVVANHAAIPGLSGGYAGVDMFFVISGFLITSHLLRGLEADGRVGFARFYARRARRILPASFTVLLLTIAGALIWVPPLLRPKVLGDALATALYVPNYSFAVQGTDYLAETTPSVFQHYWSLGIEEQFYLVWPALLALVFLLRGRRRAVLAVLAVIVAASFACGVVETYHDQPWAFFSLWTRAWELGAGGVVAVGAGWAGRRLPAWAGAALGWLGLAGILAALLLFDDRTTFPGVAAALPVVATALVVLGGVRDGGAGPGRLLAIRPLQFIGLISYSLYLVHWPVLELAQAAAGYDRPLPLWATAAFGAASVPLAWLLYRFVEDPARRAAWLARARPRRTLVTTAGATAVIASVAVIALLVTSLLPAGTGPTVARHAPSSPPQATAFVPANLRPSLQQAADDNPSLYADGCEVGFHTTVPHLCSYGGANAPRIVLFGDSHAAQWFPALQKIADRDGYRLDTETKSGCPSVAVEISRNNAPYDTCDGWRQNVIADLRADPPAAVVLSNYSEADYTSTVDEQGQWERGLEQTADSLADVTKVLLIADTPDLRISPTVCLSAHPTAANSCGRPASVALDTPGRHVETAAAARSGATIIDLTGYFCTQSWCPPIIGDTLVYRDSHHITATFSAELAGPLGSRMMAAMTG